jgi:hypothetical protein
MEKSESVGSVRAESAREDSEGSEGSLASASASTPPRVGRQGSAAKMVGDLKLRAQRRGT